MAVTEYDLTCIGPDLFGVAFDPNVSKIVFLIETNLGAGEAIVDLTTGEVRLGSGRGVADSSGTHVFTNLVGSDSDPEDIGLAEGTLQYRVRAEYFDAITRKRVQWYSGWFSLTEDTNLATVVTEQYAPAEWQTAFMQQAQELLDQQLEISGLTDLDESQAYNIESGTATPAALRDATVQPLLRDTDYTVAKLYYVNVKDFGAVGDYENSAHDDTADFQAAIDAAAAAGGGIVQVPPGKYRISQIVMKKAVHLRGTAYSHGGITPVGVGSELISKESANVDMIRVEQDGVTGYAVEHGLSYLMGYGSTGQTAGSFYALKDAAGNPLKWTHGSFAHHIIGRRFKGDVMWLGGGSGVQHIHTIFGYLNGGYTIRIVGADADSIQFVYLADISGDGNLGDGSSGGGTGAVLRIEGQSAGYTAFISGLKSEQIVNSNFAGAGAPAGVNALSLHDCAGFVVVNGLQHISSTSNTYKPGDAIAITGSLGVRPTVAWSGVKIRTLVAQVTGTTPALLHDTSNGGDRSIPQDVIRGVYGTTIDARDQSVSTSRHLFGVVGAHVQPTVVSNELSQRGDTPGLTLVATNGGTNEKVWTVYADSTNKRMEFRTTDDAGAVIDRFWRVERANGSAIKQGWFGATPVVQQPVPGTTDGVLRLLQSLGFVASGAIALNDELTTGQEAVSRDLAGTSNTLSSGQLRLSYFTARKSETVATLRTVSGTAAGATPTLCKVGLFTVAGNGDITLVASTANTTSLWSAANTGYETALSTPYAVTAGTRYAVGVLCVTGASAPTVVGATAGDVGKSPRICGLVTGQTDLPSSVVAGSVGDSGNRPYVALLP